MWYDVDGCGEKTTTFMLFSFLLLLSFRSVSMFLSVFSRLGRGLYECMHSHIHDQSWYILVGWVDEWMMMNDLQHIRDRCCCFFLDDAWWCALASTSNPIQFSLSLLSLIQSKPKHNINKTHTASRAFLLFVLFRFSISFRSSIWLSSECSRFSILKFNKNP